MAEKKLEIDDTIHFEEYDHLRYDPVAEQRQQDERFYRREKSMLETSVVYIIIGIGVIIGSGILLQVKSYHSKREKEAKHSYQKRQENEIKKRDFVEKVNSVKNSLLEIKDTNISEYSSTELKEAEDTIIGAETELGKYHFDSVNILLKKAKDKLEEASMKAKQIIDKKEQEESEKKRIADEKKRIEEEKRRQAEREKTEKEKQKQREDALKKLQELQKMLNQ